MDGTTHTHRHTLRQTTHTRKQICGCHLSFLTVPVPGLCFLIQASFIRLFASWLNMWKTHSRSLSPAYPPYCLWQYWAHGLCVIAASLQVWDDVMGFGDLWVCAEWLKDQIANAGSPIRCNPFISKQGYSKIWWMRGKMDTVRKEGRRNWTLEQTFRFHVVAVNLRLQSNMLCRQSLQVLSLFQRPTVLLTGRLARSLSHLIP